jgi:hypothetical protein
VPVEARIALRHVLGNDTRPHCNIAGTIVTVQKKSDATTAAPVTVLEGTRVGSGRGTRNGVVG